MIFDKIKIKNFKFDFILELKDADILNEHISLFSVYQNNLQIIRLDIIQLLEF